MEISNLSDKEFKITVIQINKELENTKNQTEMKNTTYKESAVDEIIQRNGSVNWKTE